jgi:hypothetical protein
MLVAPNPFSVVLSRREPFVHVQTFNIEFPGIVPQIVVVVAGQQFYLDVINQIFNCSDMRRVTRLPPNANMDVDVRFSGCQPINVKCLRRDFNISFIADKLCTLTKPPNILHMMRQGTGDCNKVHVRVDATF